MKVNIIGKAGYITLPEGETWGVNENILWYDLKTVFAMHDYQTLWHNAKMRAAIEKVNRLGIPFISLGRYDDIPTSIEYPLQEIIQYFGVDYFASSIDYMLAYAIYKGATEIDLYAVDMLQDAEYIHQKPSVEFWIGFALGKGIKVCIHGERSEILKIRERKLYGYNIEQSRTLNG